ncbi:peptidyl-prolyl cis-trans isomerase [Flavobacteriaceae bacterium F89]|uniref:Peptidyl-prolyl cis-trans isomerase n=1 Tax=Cerina litoralis TaxID=2874477 RepID=A0AAE3JRC8_9FLAO|nr:peptidyl-prolyl cis-trans isomerase [Cerina litoralis]MCG2459512.1 peptidyl-prolyl cis-trans isomerase [Cerina litoralis]
MFLSKRKFSVITVVLAAYIFVILAASCNFRWKKAEEKVPLARVDEAYLYKEDVARLLVGNMTKEDSASFVTNYINDWATKQLLLSKAKINLPEEKLAEFDKLVSDYRTDLYTRAYKEALVKQALDTAISDTDLKTFYDQEKENFKLKEELVQLRYIELPSQFLDKKTVIQKLKRFNKDDIVYLDSIGVQFRKVNFNDSIWVPVSRLISEIPPLTVENQHKYLKKSQFFELQDSIGVYLGHVTNLLQVNDETPLSYIKPEIRQVLLNRRRIDYSRKLEVEIIDEAIKNKEFEVYDK